MLMFPQAIKCLAVLLRDRGNRSLAQPAVFSQMRQQFAGLPDIRIHDLRYCFASTAVAHGESLRARSTDQVLWAQISTLGSRQQNLRLSSF